MTLKEKRKFWQAHITTWQRSGLSKVEYCRQHGLALKQMWYWLRRYRSEVLSEAVTLVPIRLTKCGDCFASASAAWSTAKLAGTAKWHRLAVVAAVVGFT